MESLWQLQEAKNRFSELVNRAIADGPQEISRHGKKTAVILSVEEYRRLKKDPHEPITDFFRRSPLSQITLERNRDYPREVEL
ncbi:MAG: type II toxin-antitoxin system Phd/YefM family antitoxin [Chitinispirillaceae bacterium]|nr:type II toxin-antitoxin system Phd/YefM family antitoxin [Chitinispirillaceae bacterium]